MADKERQDPTNQVDDQETIDAEASDQQRAARLRRRVENVPVSTTAAAPVDDDVIIK